MGTVAQMNVGISGGDVTFPGSVQPTWVTLHDSLNATAETSTVLMRPSSYSNTNVHPARISPQAVRVSIMARYATGTTTVTTSPVVRLYGIWGPDDAVSAAGVIDESKAIVRRLDTGSSNGAGITLTLTTAASASAINDVNYRYSDEFDISGTDLRGAKWVMALTETASNVSGGADSNVVLLAMATN